MKRILIILHIMLVVAVKVWADGLTSTIVRFGPEDSAELTLSLQNENEQWNSYQFVLTLPEGIEWAKDSDGKYLYQLSSRHDTSYILTVHQQADNRYSVVCYSSKGTPLTGTEGKLLSLTIEANDSLRGKQVTAIVSEVLFSTRTGQETALSNLSIDIIVTAPLVVTANSYTREYGDANPRFDYTATGQEVQGIPMIYCEATSSSPVGTYPIVISKGSVENINDSYVNGTLTITKAPLTISVNSITKYQGDPMPELTVTYSGFKNGETESVLITLPTITCVATAESPSGTYPITLSGAEAQNYEISYVHGALTVIEPDPVYVRATDKTREYGDENPAFDYTATGATLVGEPEISCEATRASPVGTYPIVISKGNVKNYNDHYTNGRLTVTKAPLTISVEKVAKKQGDPVPVFTVTYSGFKNGETEAVLTSKPTVTCEVTVDSPAGSYPIVVSGASAANYEIMYVEGTCTVYEGVVLTAVDYSRVYGDENPTFTYTYKGDAPIGEPAITCEATATSPVGTYPIVITQGSISNKGTTCINGTLTIKPAPLTITTTDAQQVYGDELPEFSPLYYGFKNGETESVLTTHPVLTCEGRDVGTYPIAINGGEAQNYEITHVNGTLTITPAPLTITANDCERIYGDETPAFAVTYEGFKYEDTASELTISPVINCDGWNVGSYPITVSGAEARNYEISYKPGTLTIMPASLTITANDANQEYGDEIPTLTVTYDGFKNGETETVLTVPPIVSCDGKDVGSYPITISGAEARNYQISYQEGTLAITKASLRIVAADAQQVYGDELPELSVTYEGFKNGETETVLTILPTIRCDGSNAGSYPIVVNGAEAQNYEISYTDGTLTIKPAPLNITATDAQQVYGDELTEFSPVYHGFKNDETEAVLTTPPVFSCTGRDVGNYPIMVSGATAQNYEISYTEGTLTITPAPLTITANDVNQEYGDGMPTLSVTYDGFKYGETELVLSTMPMIDCQGVDVGTYPINVSGAAAKNYKITHVDGMLTITPAPLTVTAKDASRYDGVENPPFEVEYSGWKLDDDVSVLTEVPIASSMADENSLPGEYPITVSGGAAQNYVLQYVAGTLTVIQLPSYIVPYNNMTFHIPDALIPEVTLKVAADVSHVTIPSKVQYRGKEWIVTEVSDSVFMGREKLVTAEIPATIKKIGKDVFGDCSHLAAIVWRAPVKMTSSMMGDFSNPNLLLYMADKTNALEGVTNVIDLNDMMAERILLKDDEGTNDFYCPLAFTANEISYTHEYSQETKSGSSQGWESLVLPFDVAEVTHQEKGRIHPFAKLTSQQIINGEKPFWLYTFTKDNDFKEADAIRANTPYIISMPNEKDLWDDYILKGQVTFRATNAKVHATSEASGVQGVNKAFTPNYRKETVADYFLLNVEDRYNDHAEGSVFARGRRGAHPFEAYFTTTADVKEFGVFEKEDLTPVRSLKREGRMGAVYDMQGRQIVNGKLSNGKLPKGLYIVNGKKVSVK